MGTLKPLSRTISVVKPELVGEVSAAKSIQDLGSIWIRSKISMLIPLHAAKLVEQTTNKDTLLSSILAILILTKKSWWTPNNHVFLKIASTQRPAMLQRLRRAQVSLFICWCSTGTCGDGWCPAIRFTSPEFFVDPWMTCCCNLGEKKTVCFFGCELCNCQGQHHDLDELQQVKWLPMGAKRMPNNHLMDRFLVRRMHLDFDPADNAKRALERFCVLSCLNS